MKNCVVVVAMAIALLAFSPALGAQTAGQFPSGVDIHRDGWDRVVCVASKGGRCNPPEGQVASGPAPVRDLTGIWEPRPRYRAGVQATGALNYPSDGKPEHQLPFTPLGLKTWKEHKPGFGVTAVPIAQNNDPFDICDPIGFPRIELFNLRAVQIWENQDEVQVLYQNDNTYRTIWTDGRKLPKEILEPRWYGYSVGKWVDDYTFVVQTTGLDERTWLDNVGRPHSDELMVTETFHRVDKDTLTLTLTITDPKMYTKPWTALTNFQMKLQPKWFDIREMICAPSEAIEYNKTVAAEAAAAKGKK
jgi:hypothetical protein